jgi:hypothetical protein
MSLTGRIDEGMVTQDDTTIDDGNDDLGYLTDTDPEIHAELIRVLRMVDALLVANGRGTHAKRQAAHLRELEDDLNGRIEEEEWGGEECGQGSGRGEVSLTFSSWLEPKEQEPQPFLSSSLTMHSFSGRSLPNSLTSSDSKWNPGPQATCLP